MLRSVVVLALLAAPATAAELLKGPYPPHRGTATAGKFVCPETPAPVIDLPFASYYADANHSVIDDALYRQNVAAVKPLRDYLRLVTAATDRARAGDASAAHCALDHLTRWAKADALTGTATPQGGYERKWNMGGAALAYLAVRDAPGLDGSKRDRVEAWLRRLARLVQPVYERSTRADNRNNHAYWAGLAVAAVGVATGERALLDWGLARYRLGVAEIAADGTLPLEMARRSRALHYHLFALAPLVLLAELGEANGIALYRERDGALHRLVRRVADGVSDPSSFAAAAGAEQTPARLAGEDAGWLEPYAARFGDAAVMRLAARARPVRSAWLGGDLTLAFASPRP